MECTKQEGPVTVVGKATELSGCRGQFPGISAYLEENRPCLLKDPCTFFMLSIWQVFILIQHFQARTCCEAIDTDGRNTEHSAPSRRSPPCEWLRWEKLPPAMNCIFLRIMKNRCVCDERELFLVEASVICCLILSSWWNSYWYF